VPVIGGAVVDAAFIVPESHDSADRLTSTARAAFHTVRSVTVANRCCLPIPGIPPRSVRPI
jgi:hypothetical protein